jgi:putative hydrolase of HD superfamily
MRDLNTICDYLCELDALKLVNRRSYVGGGVRLENSAEHSWHLAMACWSIARNFDLKIDEGKLLKLALVHDLGEIDAGDTFLYAAERAHANKAERACVARLQQHRGNGIEGLLEYWEEQETGSSPEAQLIKVVDRLLPFLLNVSSEGRAWRENRVRKSQVLAAHAFVETEFPAIYQWIDAKIEYAVAQEWLEDA